MNQIAKVEEICSETRTSNKMEKLQTNSSKEDEVQTKKKLTEIVYLAPGALWEQGHSPPPRPFSDLGCLYGRGKTVTLLKPGLRSQTLQGRVRFSHLLAVWCWTIYLNYPYLTFHIF